MRDHVVSYKTITRKQCNYVSKWNIKCSREQSVVTMNAVF